MKRIAKCTLRRVLPRASRSRASGWAGLRTTCKPTASLWSAGVPVRRKYAAADDTDTDLGDPDAVFYTSFKRFFDRAADTTDISPGLRHYIERSDCVVRVEFPLVNELGDIDIITGYRCHHSRHQRPCLGGLRFSSKLTLSSSMAFAALNSIKAAVMDIPFGGSEGGIVIDPKHYDKEELERITRAYTTRLLQHRCLGPGIDIVAPNIGSGPREMAWVVDTFQRFQGGEPHVDAMCVAVGKPVGFAGIRGRKTSSALGCFLALQQYMTYPEVLEKTGFSPGLEGKTATILGFGNMGMNLATLLQDAGVKILAIADSSGGVAHMSDGLDVAELVEHKKKGGTIREWADAQKKHGFIRMKDPLNALEVDCDICIPAARARTIRFNNAFRVRAKMILEASEGPTTVAAGDYLAGKGVVILPDVTTTAGDTVVGFFEYLKNISHVRLGRMDRKWQQLQAESVLEYLSSSFGWEASISDKAAIIRGASEEDIVRSGLEHIIAEGIQETRELAVTQGFGTDYRTAAYAYAIRKIANNMEESGMFLS